MKKIGVILEVIFWGKFEFLTFFRIFLKFNNLLASHGKSLKKIEKISFSNKTHQKN